MSKILKILDFLLLKKYQPECCFQNNRLQSYYLHLGYWYFLLIRQCSDLFLLLFVEWDWNYVHWQFNKNIRLFRFETESDILLEMYEMGNISLWIEVYCWTRNWERCTVRVIYFQKNITQEIYHSFFSKK